MTITQTSQNFVIQFQYAPYLLRAVKELPGKRFDASSKTWTVPLHARQQVEAFAARYKFNWGASDLTPESFNDIPQLPELDADISFLKRDLYDYQKRGIAYMLKHQRVIVGDDMGLGKTCQAIVAAVASGQLKKGPALIICPASLKLNWQREIEIWTKYRGLILDDRTRYNWHRYFETELAQFFIVNYESLKKFFVKEIDKVKRVTLKNVHFYDTINLFSLIIIDESHRVKTFGRQQTRYTAGICAGKQWIFALTGTPVLNKPSELCPQLGIIGQLHEFGGYKKFMDRYCSGTRQASNLKELNYKLNLHCFYRRKKTEVLKELPAKTRTLIYCDISTRNEYNAAQADLASYMAQFKGMTPSQVDKSMKGEIMVRIGILKNISARGKIAAVSEWLHDIISSGSKVSIWAELHQVMDCIYKEFPCCLKITGRESLADRQYSIDQFQNNPDEKLIACGIRAAGVGVTLTSGSTCGFIELGWHAGIMDQCEDRHHRIGQKDNVGCYYFLGKDTIDEWIYHSVIEPKRDISDQVTGNVDDVDVNVVDGFINLFNQK